MAKNIVWKNLSKIIFVKNEEKPGFGLTKKKERVKKSYQCSKNQSIPWIYCPKIGSKSTVPGRAQLTAVLFSHIIKINDLVDTNSISRRNATVKPLIYLQSEFAAMAL